MESFLERGASEQMRCDPCEANPTAAGIFVQGLDIWLPPFGTAAVPFWGTNCLEFEWFVPQMGLQCQQPPRLIVNSWYKECYKACPIVYKAYPICRILGVRGDRGCVLITRYKRRNELPGVRLVQMGNLAGTMVLYSGETLSRPTTSLQIAHY